MTEFIVISLIFVIACVIMAISVWLITKSKMKPDKAISNLNGELNDDVGKRRSMHIGDWVNVLVLAILGVLLGVVFDALLGLLTTAFWPVAIIIPLLFLSLLLFSGLLDKMVDCIIPSGIRPARKQQKVIRKPLLIILSFPIGFVLGFILSRIGYSDTILGLIS